MHRNMLWPFLLRASHELGEPCFCVLQRPTAGRVLRDEVERLEGDGIRLSPILVGLTKNSIKSSLREMSSDTLGSQSSLCRGTNWPCTMKGWHGSQPAMPAERLSMRKVREVLRLKHEIGLSYRAISDATGIGKTAAAEYMSTGPR